MLIGGRTDVVIVKTWFRESKCCTELKRQGLRPACDVSKCQEFRRDPENEEDEGPTL